MDDERPSPPGPPALRPWAPLPAVPRPPPAGPPPVEPPPTERPAVWKRLTRTARGTAGLGIGAAALLLWPFSEWSVLPWLAGVGALVLLALLRLDRLLHGWVWHLAGLVVVGGLMLSTSPWAWALAASIGVLVAGLLQLPAWRLAAVGAVLCVVSGAAFAFANVQDAREAAAAQTRASEESFALSGERSPERVLPALLEGIGQGDVVAVCGLLDESARAAFVGAAGAPDCRAAVGLLRGAAGTPPEYDDLDAPTVPQGTSWATDACATPWADLAGAALGRIEIRQSDPPGRTYFLAGFRPC